MVRNNKIKVIHFTIANSGGGVTKFVLNLWKHINRNRFQFDFATMSPYLDFAADLEREGCKIHYITAYAEDDRVQFVKEVKAILANGYDVVHLHTNWWRGFLLEEIAKEMGVPKVIVHAHSSDVHIKENQSRDDARRLHNEQKVYVHEGVATDFWACSWKAAEWLYGDRITKDKIRIIPNAIDLEAFVYNADTRAIYRKRFGWEDEFVIGHVGRFCYEKNHDFLVDIFAEVVKKNAKARMLLVGVGELQEKIRDKVKAIGLENRVTFVGKREDVNCLMQAMDMFVLPSRFEGLGIVLIEAQAAGLKCLTSDVVPLEALITENIKSIPLEKDIWVKEILNVSRYVREGNAISVLRENGYDIDSMVRTIESIYQDEREEKGV